MKTVYFIYYTLPHYRLGFYENVREILNKNDVKFNLIYGIPEGENLKKKDIVDIAWAKKIETKWIKIGASRMCWHNVFGSISDSDLTVIYQENKIIENYILQVQYMSGHRKIAFFGHGKNFQSDAPKGLRERWKRFWLTKVHWWFAYTEGSARIVEAAGFPREHITVFNNSIDTGAIRRDVESIPPEEIEALRYDLGITSDNIGIYIGGMYKEKRLDFLIEAAQLIRAQVPDFHLLLVGAGIDAAIAEQAAAEHDFIRYLGPKFGREKTALAMMSKVFLMPGLVGLAVLDSFAYGLPMITTNVPYHSPEIEYLENEVNGLIVPDPEDVSAYAEAVVKLLRDESYRREMRAAGLRASENYSIESMAERFADGVLKALEAPPLRRSSC